MINWPYFQSNILAFNTGKASTSSMETAEFYSTTYYNSIITANLLIGNTIIPNPSAKEILKIALYNFFTLNLNLTIPFTPLQVMPVTNAFISFWMMQTFQPLPPHPPTVLPSPGPVVTIGGTVEPLNTALFVAFNTGTSDGFVTALTTALQAHSLTMQGTYSGMTATTPPVLAVVDWFGVF